MVTPTTSGTATAPIVLMNERREDCAGTSVAATSFCSCNCRMASSATSSVTSEFSERCMLCATVETVVDSWHASQAAPAVAFSAKTACWFGSTMMVEPSGSLFTTRPSEWMRSICMWPRWFSNVSMGYHAAHSTWLGEFIVVRRVFDNELSVIELAFLVTSKQSRVGGVAAWESRS
jgi:hypothetical protein